MGRRNPRASISRGKEARWVVWSTNASKSMLGQTDPGLSDSHATSAEGVDPAIEAHFRYSCCFTSDPQRSGPFSELPLTDAGRLHRRSWRLGCLDLRVSATARWESRGFWAAFAIQGARTSRKGRSPTIVSTLRAAHPPRLATTHACAQVHPIWVQGVRHYTAAIGRRKRSLKAP